MAEPRVKIRLEADASNAIAGITQAEGALGRLSNGVRSAVSSFAAIGAATAFVGLLKDAAQAAIESEEGARRLSAALGPLGDAAQKVQAALDNQASAIQSITRFEDDAVTSVQARIAALTTEQGQIEKTTQAIVELAAAQGISLDQAAQAVIGSATGAGRAMKQYGIEVADAGTQSEKLATVTEKVLERFSGAAQRQVDDFGASLARLGNSWGSVIESMGRFVTESTTATSAMETLSGLGTFVSAHLDFLRESWFGVTESMKGASQAAQQTKIDISGIGAAAAQVKGPIDFLAETLNTTTSNQLEAEVIKIKVALEGARVSGELTWNEMSVLTAQANTKVAELEGQIERLRQGLPAVADAAEVGLGTAAKAADELSTSMIRASHETEVATTALVRSGQQAVLTAKQFDTLARAAESAALAQGQTSNQAFATGRDAATEAALAAGGRLTQGGTRVRLVGGGSRLTGRSSVGGVFGRSVIGRSSVSSDGRIGG